MRYIQILSNSGEVQTALDSQELGKPYLVYLEDEHRLDWNSKSLTPPLSAQPLTFEIISGGTITYSSTTPSWQKTIFCTVNNGEGYMLLDSANTINVVPGDKLTFYGDGHTTQYGETPSHYMYFGGTAKFKAYGNIMSLLVDYDGDFSSATTLVSSLTFCNLFDTCRGLTDASNLILPATTLTEFCYSTMFGQCTSLATAPELPATTLASYCYYQMFINCTSLITTPELPATTLVKSCYSNMFKYCTSLNYVKCLATDIPTGTCTSDWLEGVSSTGTFYKNPNMTSWTSGPSGIPANWTIQNAVN